MGYFNARELRAYLPEDQALTWHLQHNHYPPISLIYLPAVREALEFARNGDFKSNVTLPSGKRVPVWEIVEWFHLQAFIDPDES